MKLLEEGKVVRIEVSNKATAKARRASPAPCTLRSLSRAGELLRRFIHMRTALHGASDAATLPRQAAVR